MCLFTKGRNAVVAILDLALHEKFGPVALPGICERTGMAMSYVEAIFRRLRNNGIVLSIRGPNGGFLLARTADELTVADIVMAMDETLEACADSDGRDSPGRRRCRTEPAAMLWGTLNDQLVTFLHTISIKDLTERHRTSRH